MKQFVLGALQYDLAVNVAAGLLLLLLVALREPVASWWAARRPSFRYVVASVEPGRIVPPTDSAGGMPYRVWEVRVQATNLTDRAATPDASVVLRTERAEFRAEAGTGWGRNVFPMESLEARFRVRVPQGVVPTSVVVHGTVFSF